MFQGYEAAMGSTMKAIRDNVNRADAMTSSWIRMVHWSASVGSCGLIGLPVRAGAAGVATAPISEQ